MKQHLFNRHWNLFLVLFSLFTTIGTTVPSTHAMPAVEPQIMATPLNEVEPNDRVDEAMLLTLDNTSQATILGTINAATDADWYRLTTGQPGATVNIRLTGLPADYDLALIADPTQSISNSDSVDLDTIFDTGKITSSGRITSIGSSNAFSRIKMSGELTEPGRIISISANANSADESIQAYLPEASSYYMLVYSGDGRFDATQTYRLDVTLTASTLTEPEMTARPVSSLGMAVFPNDVVQTIFVYNSDRMNDHYPDQEGTIRELDTLLKDTSDLLIQSQGITLDLSEPLTVGSTNVNAIRSLYTQWDNNPAQPFYANAVAEQIWNILDFAITNYYSGTTSIVVVGGDAMIPFYRVPDETVIAPERDYYDQLNAAGAFPNPGVRDTPLKGSLFYQFMQTDTFYADRAPTPWRGRSLYIPDLAIGRLVETPETILSYLRGQELGGGYVVQADRPDDNGTGSGAAGVLVTGYDFLSDQADAVARQLTSYGFAPAGSSTTGLGLTPTLNLLNNNTWSLNEFTDLWFSRQLAQLTESYQEVQTRYHLMSINSHFTHYSAIPANQSGSALYAERIYTPTVRSAAFQNSYFNNFNADNPPVQSSSLVYSIGGHSGLSVPNQAMTSTRFAADFAEATLKQGGNWIGNTGSGYGDSDLTGYSERLSLLFTEAIGREIRILDDDQYEYTGATIGESLTWAKRAYIRSAGSGGLSAFDEKVVLQMTLYGLPFIRVRVPRPVAPPDAYDGQFDPPQRAVPDNLPVQDGTFTRIITFTNTFTEQVYGRGRVPYATSVVVDSYLPGITTSLSSTSQMSPGRPVLPALEYDITLLPRQPGGAVPVPRGIRLISATALPLQQDYAFKTTNIITEQIYSQQQNSPLLDIRGRWLPEQMYAHQRTVQMSATGDEQVTDRLITIPAQVRSANGQTGELRRLAQLVVEITYIDPDTAPLAVLNDTTPPLIQNVAVDMVEAQQHSTATTTQSVQVEAFVNDDPGTPDDNLRVRAIYSLNGTDWRWQALTPRGAGQFSITLSVSPPCRSLQVFLEAQDAAGNVTVFNGKGTFLSLALHQVYLPFVDH